LLKYQLAALAMLFVGVRTVRLPLKARTGLSLTFITFLLAVLAAEGTLYYQSTTLDRMKNRRATAAGVFFDTRSGAQVVAESRSSGEPVQPLTPPSVLAPLNGFDLGEGRRIYPLGGISHTKTVFCNESGEWVFYLSDRFGFNNPEQVYDSTAIDIAMIGDSFTHGICMPEGKDLGSLLRAAGYSTLNFGYSGNGILTELATLQEYAVPHQPEIVLWIYFEGNDQFSFLDEGRSPLLQRYLDRDYSQGLIHQQSLIDSLLKAYWDERLADPNPRNLAENFVYCLVSLCTSRKLLGIYDSPPPPPVFETIIADARDRVAAWGGRLYFVYLPEWRRYAAPFRPDKMHGRGQVLSLIAGLGIPVIDFDEILSAQENPLSFYPFQLPLHFNESGYKLLAGQILSRLD
jgi:lysophospholipase L1-like esterase